MRSGEVNCKLVRCTAAVFISLRLGSAHSIPRVSLVRDEAGQWRRRCPSRGRCAGRQGHPSVILLPPPSGTCLCLWPRPGQDQETLSLAFASLQHSRHQHHGPSLPSRRHMDGSGWPVSYTPSHRAMMPVPRLRCLPACRRRIPLH